MPTPERSTTVMRAWAAACAAVVGVLAGCGGRQSALDPAGPAAAEIARLWWIMLVASLAIAAAVIAFAVYVAMRRPDARLRARPVALIVGGGIVVPAVAVLSLLLAGVGAGRMQLPLPSEREVFRVELRAHQWWWEVRYPDLPGGALHDANELHLPVGRPVDVHLTSADVIHSFWVPPLGGKRDAIPGIVNVIRIEASRAGSFRGQCAEFCGAQHARMALVVHAHEPADLERRLAELAADRASAALAADAPLERAFGTHCGSCHSVDPRRRAPAVGPNLAAVAQRATLGAGTIGNGPGEIARWLRDHPRLKPGSRKPALDGVDRTLLDALADRLQVAP